MCRVRVSSPENPLGRPPDDPGIWDLDPLMLYQAPPSKSLPIYNLQAHVPFMSPFLDRRSVRYAYRTAVRTAGS